MNVIGRPASDSAAFLCAAFFKQAFNAMQSEASLVEYTVLDVEPTSSRGSQGIKQTQKKDQKSASGSSGKRVPGAMIEVALSADFGVNDNTHITLSHLVSSSPRWRAQCESAREHSKFGYKCADCLTIVCCSIAGQHSAAR